MAESYRVAFDKALPLINPTSRYGWGKGNYLPLFIASCAFLPAVGAALFVAQDLIVSWLAGYEGLSGWLLPIRILIGFGIVLAFVSIFSMYAVWLERKVSGRIQSRLGPMEVGWFHGWLQTLADGFKLMAKEDLIPRAADKGLFILAPIFSFTGVLLTYLIVPFHGQAYTVDALVGQTGGVIADLSVGLYFFTAIGAVEAIGVIMAGWASNNKWALFGAMRTATQVVSYELPIGLCYLSVVVVAGSLRISEIVAGQGGWFVHWYVFKSPFLTLAFIIYFIASLAETKRAPFDLPEAESELVAGFHTEYSSMRFSIFFLAEYAAMFVAAALAVTMFLGGWSSGIGPIHHLIAGWGEGGGGGRIVALGLGTAIAVGKALILIFLQIWIRWTYPRVRLDQVMHLCLKVLLPFGMVAVFGATLWEVFLPGRSFFGIFPGGG